jgi:hypothetical protein
MSDGTFIDRLPSQEREKIRKRLRSPEEYERLREKVKGPEDLEREMEKNAEFAEAKLHLESDPKAQEKAKDAVKAFISEKGMEAAFEGKADQIAEAIAKGQFDVVVDDKKKEPTLAVAPSGNVAEVFPLKQSLQQHIFASITMKGK